MAWVALAACFAACSSGGAPGFHAPQDASNIDGPPDAGLADGGSTDTDGPRADADAAVDGGPDAVFDVGHEAQDAAQDAAQDEAQDVSADFGGLPDAPGPVDASGDVVHDSGAADVFFDGATGDGPSTCPTIASTNIHYVDQTEGVDDPSHGGGMGACAFRTLTYALAHADREIQLLNGVFSAAKGETLPFVLTGHQGLLCQSATIAGQGDYLGTHATIVFTGTYNWITDCQITGDGSGGSCIDMRSDGSAAPNPHTLDSVEVSHCGDAAVSISGTNVAIRESFFHDSAVGVRWLAAAPVGLLELDEFADDATADITCAATSPDVTGADNLRLQGQSDASVGATPVCTTCQLCPFQ